MMEQDTLNDSHASAASEEATPASRPKVSFAINQDTEENGQGESKPATPNGTPTTRPSKKKPETTHTVRAPYAQPVLDASKAEAAKSTLEERLASAKERRSQQQRQFELGLKSRREREDLAHAKWMQSIEEKRQKIEENKMKDVAHRKEVELRKKQQLEEDKKRAEAKVARVEQVHEVKMRQKRNSSSDQASKRWSWGENNEQKSASQMNLSGSTTAKQPDKFSRSPLHMNISHMEFASGLRSYSSQEKLTKGTSPGRTASSGLTEPVTISPRLLAPTRASLARSRNAVNDLDDNVSQSSADSKGHGPMRSRSKDRRSKDQTASRPGSSAASPLVDGAKGQSSTERKSTPTRGTSPMAPGRGSPAAPEMKKMTGVKATFAGSSKPKKSKDFTPPRPLRMPSPASKPAQPSAPPQTTPTKTTSKRAPSPVPATKPGAKRVQNASKAPSVSPIIKQSLRPTAATQKMKPKTSPTSKQATSKKESGVKSAGTKATKSSVTKSKKDTPKMPQNLDTLSFDKGISNLPQGGAAVTTSAIPTNDTLQQAQNLEPTEKPNDKIDEPEPQKLAELKQTTPPSDEPRENPPFIFDSQEVATEVSDDMKNNKEPGIVALEGAMYLQNGSRENEQRSGSDPLLLPANMAPEISLQNQAPDEVHLAAESGFHLDDRETENLTTKGARESQDEPQTVETGEISPTDSLDDGNTKSELPQLIDLGTDQPQHDSLDSETDEEVSVKEKIELKNKIDGEAVEEATSQQVKESAVDVSNLPQNSTESLSGQVVAPEGVEQEENDNTQATERKSQPRNLETDEDKEAYRQAIAEKRRELKEKKEQEERERQERMRLAKIEQAKREEEARRMFEEAAAAAENEKVEREKQEKEQAEEEKKRQEEDNARKRDAAEKLRKERELQKQKQEDERTARKKRLEMIMRRTRQPDAPDSAKRNDDSTPSSATQSPISGASPQTQSPVGGKSPLSATTPERSVSPGVPAILNERENASPNSEESKTVTGNVNQNEANLLNFANSSMSCDTSGVELIDIRATGDAPAQMMEKPVPFEAFTAKTLVNGIEESTENHNGSNISDPFDLVLKGSESSKQQTMNGSQDFLGLATDATQQQNTLSEPLVPAEI